MARSKCFLVKAISRRSNESWVWPEPGRKPFTSYPAFVCLIVSLVNGGLVNGRLEEIVPKSPLGLPVGLVGDLSELVFGDFGEAFVLVKQDVFLDRRREERHGHQLVDSGVAHV